MIPGYIYRKEHKERRVGNMGSGGYDRGTPGGGTRPTRGHCVTATLGFGGAVVVLA